MLRAPLWETSLPVRDVQQETASPGATLGYNPPREPSSLGSVRRSQSISGGSA